MKPHNKKYYGGLTVIAVIMIATAFLLQMYGSEDMGDIAGLAAEPTEQESVEDMLQKGGTVEITYGTTKYTVTSAYQNYVLSKLGATPGVTISYSKNSYEDVLGQIATLEGTPGAVEVSVVAYADDERQFSYEESLSADHDIVGVLGNAIDTVVGDYNEYYYPELYPTSEQEVREEPAPEETGEADTGDTGAEDTGETAEEEADTGAETGDTGAEDTGETGETVQEEAGEMEDTGDMEEENQLGEVTPEQIVVETTPQEEIIVSYKDIFGAEYSWGAITYDGVKYTVELADGSIPLNYLTDKEKMLTDIQGMLQDQNAVSISFDEIKGGKSVATATSSIDEIGKDLNNMLEMVEQEALPEAEKTAAQKAAEAAKEKATGAKGAAPQKAETTGRYSEEDKKFIITTAAGKEVELQMVTVGGKPYGRYAGQKATYYYNKDGKVYIINEEGELVFHTDKSTLVRGEALKNLAAVLSDTQKTKDFPEDEKSKASREAKKAAEKQQKLTSLASEYGVAVSDLTTEEDNINRYLKQNYEKENWKYDAATGHYTGGTNGITYDGDNMGITVTETKDGKETTQTVYKSREKGKTTYYTLDKDGDEEKVKETDALKKQFREAEKEQDRLVNSVGNGIRSGEIQNKITINGKEVVLKTTIAEAHYLQKQYEQQKAQVKGLLTGYLNKWLDKQLGGWSRGVPAGICAQVFGLEYYKEDGWTRVPMNASSYELQSRLLANSKTAIIEGEKEEITESLFRYAYTLRLLANQSFEWQTYLYNSCSQETSEDVFYDYGSLGAGEFYSFHYAGIADRDMIFDCAQEDCLFDQACVEFTDGSETVCVSLVHGAGFETPNAGSDYDCAVTE